MKTFFKKVETVFDVELINYETTPPREPIILHREKKQMNLQN
jgi:hypothetical protein